jgi:hypothetical protein
VTIRTPKNYGAKRRTRRSWRRAEPWRGGQGGGSAASRFTTPVLTDPRNGAGLSSRARLPSGKGRRKHPVLFGRRRWRSRRLSVLDRVLALAVLVVVGFLLVGLWRITRIDVVTTGLEDGATLTAERAATLAVDITVTQHDRLAAATLTFDGTPVTTGARSAGGFRWASGGLLPDGRHELVLTVPRPVLGSSTFRWTFVVDATPPSLQAPDLVASKSMRDTVDIAGRVDPDATLTADGRDVRVTKDGSFSVWSGCGPRTPPATSSTTRSSPR